MSLLLVSHRRSVLLNLIAAADEVALSWQTPQLDLFAGIVSATSWQPDTVLITSEHLADSALVARLKVAYPNSLRLLCILPDWPQRESLWETLDKLAFDTVCTLSELTACLLALKAGLFYKSALLTSLPDCQYTKYLLGWHELTPAERRVLKLATDGKTGPQTAELLCISEKTISNHKAKISQKLGVSGGPGSLIRFILTHRDQLQSLLKETTIF